VIAHFQVVVGEVCCFSTAEQVLREQTAVGVRKQASGSGALSHSGKSPAACTVFAFQMSCSILYMLAPALQHERPAVAVKCFMFNPFARRLLSICGACFPATPSVVQPYSH
jgi:hypothetical protein